MKKHLFAVMTAIALQSSHAALTSTLDLNFQSYNGGSQTMVSWVFGGQMVTSYQNQPPNSSLTLPSLGMMGNFYNGNLVSSTNFSVSNAGYFTNNTTGISSPITSFQLVTMGPSLDVIQFNLSPSLSLSANDSYSFVTQSSNFVILPIPIGYFNAGTYSNQLSLNIAATTTIDPVPEPSTYALFGIGAIGTLMALRRKKAA
jgi:hypothetical protein